MHSYFSSRSGSSIVSIQVHTFSLNMCDIIIYVARWWEKYLSKRRFIKPTCSWHDKLIIMLFLIKKSRNRLRRSRLISTEFRRILVLFLLTFGNDSLFKKLINLQIYNAFFFCIMRNFRDINKLSFIFKVTNKTILHNI